MFSKNSSIRCTMTFVDLNVSVQHCLLHYSLAVHIPKYTQDVRNMHTPI